MITQEEYRACLRGEMEVYRKDHIDENAHGLVIKKPFMMIGKATLSRDHPLYQNRADDVLIKQILGD